MFIIIGLAIVGAVLGVIYLSGKISSDDLITSNKDPVSAYVKQCIAEAAKEGIILLGQQGGYLYFDNFDTLSASLDPDNAEVVQLYNGAVTAPYWLYQKKGDVLDKSYMPQLVKTSLGDNSAQDQLERYITEKLPECTNHFKALQKINVIVTEKKAPIETTVVFGDEETTVTVKYQLEILQKEKVTTLDKFTTAISASPKRAYNLAKDITQYEQNNYFLEKDTMNLVHLYSGLDAEKLPPTYDFKVSQCGDLIYWNYPSVYDKFKNTLVNNLVFFGVENTDDKKIKLSAEAQPDKKNRAIENGVFNGFIHKISENKYKGMNVDYIYQDDYPLSLDLGSDGILEPKTMDINLLFLSICMAEFHFAYDFSFPVMIAVTDKESKIDQVPYLFQFPIKVIVKDNLARVRFSDVIGGAVKQQQQGINECGIEQRTSGDITVTVNDQYNKPVNDALVYFQCGPTFLYDYDESKTIIGATKIADKCFIGKTTNGKLTAKFPPCIGGSIINIRAKGYSEIAKNMEDVIEGKSSSQEYTVEKLKQVELKIQKYFVDPTQGIALGDNGEVLKCAPSTSVSQLGKKEQVMVKFTKLDAETGAIKPPPFAMYIPGNKTTVYILSGKYEVELLLTRFEAYPGEMTIKKNSESKHIPAASLFESGKTIYYPEKDVLLKSTLTGGNKFIMDISEDELADENPTLLLTMFDEGQPKIVEQVGVALQHREGCYKLNKNIAKPRFVK
ncbi:hypothetical protein HZA96_01470 [Candidatus Woesearchaeota archaeon]|nr:hypothetical protein [Candidatus Woesearchaeota archaeon]